MSHDDIKAALVRDQQRGGRFPADPELQHKAADWLAELLAENERLTTAVQQCADTLAHHECEAAEIQRLTDELDRLRLSDDYMPEGVDIVMAKLCDHKRRAEEAEQWKAEALPVINGLQELGAALGIPLGKRITGPDALAAVKALTERAEAAERAIQRVRELAQHYDGRAYTDATGAILRALDGGEQ